MSAARRPAVRPAPLFAGIVRHATLHATLVAGLLVLRPDSACGQRASEPLLPAGSPAPYLPLTAEPRAPVDPVQRATGRYTKRGLVIGAIAGAAGGVAFGTFVGLLCHGEGDPCWGVIPVGGLIGGVGGSALGAVIGAMIPRHELRRPSEMPPPDTTVPARPVETRQAARRRTGSVGAGAGYADATIEGGADGTFEGSGPAMRLAFMAELRPWLGLGPEVGQALFTDGGEVRHAAIAVRGSLPARRVAPYVAGNLGFYQTTGPSLEFFGGAIGVGMRILPRVDGDWFLDAEARFSRNLHNIEPMRMRTVFVGGGWMW